MTTDAPLFAALGGARPARAQHHTPRPGRTDEWLTPLPILEALGGARSFDLDPATPAVQPWPTALHRYTSADNGLQRRWFGRVFLNPPYSQRPFRGFMHRMAQHGHGTALIFARTETDTFRRCVWEAATACLFLYGRLVFLRPDGSPPRRESDGSIENAGAPSVLVAYGRHDTDVLAWCDLPGRFVPLRIQRSWLVGGVALLFGQKIVGETQTWRQAVAALLTSSAGPVHLDDLYRAMADHPKSRQNRHWQAKIRQQLQQGPFVNVGRGRWQYREAA